MQPRFTGTCLISRDVPALAAFYARVLEAPVAGDATFAFVRASGAQLSIFSAAGMEHMAPGSTAGSGAGRAQLEFQVEDVDIRHAALAGEGMIVVKPPTTQPWGRRSVWLRDPDGNLINLYQPIPARPDPAEVVRGYFHRLFTLRDLTACDDLLAPGYIDHDAPTGTPPGPGPTKAYVSQMLETYPDLRVDLHELHVDDRAVTVRATWHGVEANTSAVWTQDGLLLIHLNDAGQLVERWSAYRVRQPQDQPSSELKA
jgi:catechol 2,3-dioxygenase-like lactoylglutathione lyase family enzyme